MLCTLLKYCVYVFFQVSLLLCKHYHRSNVWAWNSSMACLLHSLFYRVGTVFTRLMHESSQTIVIEGFTSMLSRTKWPFFKFSGTSFLLLWFVHLHILLNVVNDIVGKCLRYILHMLISLKPVNGLILWYFW